MNNTINNTTNKSLMSHLHIGKLSLAFLYGFIIMSFVFKPQSTSEVILLSIYVYVCQLTTFIPFFFKIQFIDKDDMIMIVPACASLSMFAIFCLQYSVQIAIANIIAMASAQLAVMTFCFYRREVLEGQ